MQLSVKYREDRNYVATITRPEERIGHQESDIIGPFLFVYECLIEEGISPKTVLELLDKAFDK